MNGVLSDHQAIEEVEFELHGVVYSVTVAVHGEQLLVVKLEDKETLDTWHGEFAAKYVEDITSKTGSFKKFGVFVRMLQSAVLQQSDSVFVDLLTCQDLQLLRAKKASAAAGTHADTAAAAAQQQQLPQGLGSSKRYLILTYASEFDRVHYPLPLLPDEQPDPARFRAVIASLRQQLAAVQDGLPPPSLLQHQRSPAAGQQQQRPRSRNSRGADEADVALLVSRLEVAQAELEGERAAHRREVRKKAREVQELQEELVRSRDVARELRLRVKSLEADLEAARSSINSMAATGATGKGTGSKAPLRRPAAADRYAYSGGNSSYLSGSSKFPSRPTNNHGYNSSSRNSSRGSSPASSRGQSPSYSRPWAQNPTPPRPPRPSSAPPKQRFDPTEYVRQKREREQQRLSARRSSSSSSIPNSRTGSPAASVRSRAGSVGGRSDRSVLPDSPRSILSQGGAPLMSGSSDRRGAAALLMRGSNSSSIHSANGGSSRGGGSIQNSSSRSPGQLGGSSNSRGGLVGGRPSSVGRLQQRPGSSSSSSARDQQLGAVYGVSAAAAQGRGGGSRSSSQPRQDRQGARDTSGVRDGPGSASPGRALQGVRDKLDAYYAKQRQQQQLTHAGAVVTRQAPSPTQGMPAAAAAAAGAQQPWRQQASPVKAPPQTSSSSLPGGLKPPGSINSISSSGGGGGVLKDASSEIADIDQRLHALQTFLKMAKSNVGAA